MNDQLPSSAFSLPDNDEMLLKINAILATAETKRAKNPSTTLELTSHAIRLARLNLNNYSGELVQALILRGKMLTELSNFSEALNAATEALSIAESHDDKVAIKSVLVLMAVNYSYQGLYEEALRSLHKALQLHDAHSSSEDDQFWLAKTLNNLGYTYSMMREPEKGLPYLLQSLAILRQISDNELLSRLLDSLAKAYLLLGDLSTALPYALEAYQIAVAGNYLPVVAITATHIGQIYLNSGELTSANTYLQIALNVATEQRLVRIQAEVLQLSAGLKSQLNAPQASVDYLLEALRLAEQIDRKHHIAELLGDLARHYKAHGQFELALDYTEQHHDALNKFYSQKNSWRLRNLELVHDINQIRRENELVTQKNHALQHEIKNKQLLQYSEQLETEVKLRTIELENANQQLTSALVNIEYTQIELARGERMAAMGAMVVGVAHELNTPLGNCMLVASTIQDQTSKMIHQMQAGAMRRSDLTLYLEKSELSTLLLMKSLNNAMRLVNNFKQIAITRDGEDRRSFLLSQLIKELNDTEMIAFADNPFDIVWSIPEKLTLVSYPRAVVQLFAILIENAGLHAFEGRDNGSLNISARLIENQVELTISDNGVGMSAGIMKHIFEPFFTTKLGKGSNGLGLSIIFNLVNNVLGGSIQVSSNVGQGSCFTITIPQVVQV